MKKIVAFSLILVFAGCAKSHYRQSNLDSIEAEYESLQGGAGGNSHSEVEGDVFGNVTVSEGGGAGISAGEPGAILFEATPSQSCTNKDLWLNLLGSGIHWNAVVEITYPYSGATILLDEQSVDDCNNPIVQWIDSDQIVFRTHLSIGSLVSGFYLVSVTQPNGASNAVGLNLQWCDEDVQEVPSCGKWSDR